MGRIINLALIQIKSKNTLIEHQKCDSSCTKSKNETAATTGAYKSKLNRQKKAQNFNTFYFPRK